MFKQLGWDETARHFAIRSVAEAEAYLEHPILGRRLIATTPRESFSPRDGTLVVLQLGVHRPHLNRYPHARIWSIPGTQQPQRRETTAGRAPRKLPRM